MLIVTITISIAIAFAVSFLVFKADKKRAVPYPALTAALRGLLVLLVLLLIFLPKINKKNQQTLQPVVVILQDHSISVANALGKELSVYKKEMSTLQQSLSKGYKVINWNLDGPSNIDSPQNYLAQSTNIATAINNINEQYGPQNLSAIVLASDGWYNEGTNPLYTEMPMNGALYSIAIGDTVAKKDLRIGKIYANKTTSLNSQWEARADILAVGCKGTKQNIVLKDAQGQIIASSPIFITSDKFDASVSFAVKATKAGMQQYTISTVKAENEENTANNSSNFFIEVLDQKKKILLLAAAPHPDIKAIKEAITGLEQYEIEVKMAAEMPSNFNNYALVILHQLPNNTSKISPNDLKGKGLWLIAGGLSNYAEINNLQKCVVFGANSAIRSAEPIYNNSFSSFSMPPNTKTLDNYLPPLNVGNASVKAATNSQILFAEKNGNALWATLSGGQPTAVISGEGLWRWRMYEFKNTNQTLLIDECIRQTINMLTANNNGKPFYTELAKNIWNNPEHVQISAFLQNENNELINQPEATLSIKDSAGFSKIFNFERNGNSYKIDVGALPVGRYTYTASTTWNNKQLVDNGQFLIAQNALEDQESGCNYALMYALANKNNGNTVGTNAIQSIADSIRQNNNIRPLIVEQTEATELINWKWLFAIILLIATTEWLLRKYWMAM